MAETREYTSPDGLLRLVVHADDAGDVTVGFAGFGWHTHGDILAALAGLPVPDAVGRFVADVVGGRAVIAVSRVGGRVADVWVSDDPAREVGRAADGEEVELRFWDGTPWGGP